jgi:hypothetical protein
MAINLAITASLLFVGIALAWPGLTTAAVALTVAIVGELLFLLWRTHAIVGLALTLPVARKTSTATIE